MEKLDGNKLKTKKTAFPTYNNSRQAVLTALIWLTQRANNPRHHSFVNHCGPILTSTYQNTSLQ